MEKLSTIQRARNQDRERFEAFEEQRIRTDEITNASERLVLPMRNTFSYQLGDDGELWFQGESLGDIFDRSIAVAEELTMTQPQFLTELIRRRIERQEYDDQCRLAEAGEGSPDTLVVLSPIPDAALRGVELNAYDLERKKTLVRIYERTEQGIEATSLSLDLSDRDGLQAIATRFGGKIPEDADSEDILAMRFWAYRDELIESPVDAARKAYDTALARLYGGNWYAGRRDSPVHDAMAFIEGQPDLIASHLDEINKIKNIHNGPQLVARLETARYNFAAALTRRLRDAGDAASLAEAGDMARSNGESYKNDCPEGVTAAQSMSELGLGNKEMKCVTCPFCGHTVDAILGGGSISCPDCKTSVDTATGKVSGGKRNHKNTTKPLQITSDEKRSKLHRFERERGKKQALVMRKYGKFAVLGAEKMILGGKAYEVHDRRTGEIIGRTSA